MTDPFMEQLEDGALEPDVQVERANYHTRDRTDSAGHPGIERKNGKGRVPTYAEIERRRARVRALHERGMSVDEIVERTGLRRLTVQRDLARPSDSPTPAHIIERRGRIMELTTQGLTPADIAAELELSEYTVRRDLLIAGQESLIERVSKRRARVKELFNQGFKLDDIAKMIGVDRTIVRDDRRALGLPSANEVYEQRMEEVRRLYVDEKLSQGAIADRMGLRANQVGHIVEKLGIGRTRGRGSLSAKTLARKERHKRVRNLYVNEGLSARAIAEIEGVSESAISADIKEMGLARKAASRRFAKPQIISNAMDHMEAMATVILDQDTGLVDGEQVERWARQTAKVRKALSHVKQYQPTNNQGDSE